MLVRWAVSKGWTLSCIVWGVKLSDEKIIKFKYMVALGGRQSEMNHPTTNQKQAATTEESMDGSFDERDAWGKRDTIILGAL